MLRPVPCDNQFERDFAIFVDDANDVQAFSKLPSQFGFSIEYTDCASNLRYYQPDWVVRTVEEVYWLIETKGREDIDVAYKDRAAVIWCEYATLLTLTRGTTSRFPRWSSTSFRRVSSARSPSSSRNPSDRRNAQRPCLRSVF